MALANQVTMSPSSSPVFGLIATKALAQAMASQD